MKKVPTLFERDWTGDKSRVLDRVNPACDWVMRGEGVPTRKFDGTAVLVEGQKLFVRYDAKKGKTPPEGFRPAQDSPDDETGHWPGWLPAGEGPQYQWQRKAFESMPIPVLDGTYEVCGPHIQGNPEGFDHDILIRHGGEVVPEFVDRPLSFSMLAERLKGLDIEGIVWRHPDGRMAKIKKRDFGLRRKD